MRVSPRGQQGFSLFELIAVLGIIGALAFGIYSAYSSTQAQQRVQAETQNLNTLVTLTRNTFQSQGDYTGLQNSIITATGSFPKVMEVPGDATKIKSSWQDDGITLAPLTINSTNDGFTVTYTGGYTAGTCIDFVSKVYSYFLEVSVDGTVVASVPQINAACGDDVDIVFTTQ